MAALDHTKGLPRYASLARGDSLTLEELDHLQLELELLTSSVLVRQAAGRAERAVCEGLERGRVLPRPPPPSPAKRARPDTPQERSSKKSKDCAGKAREGGAGGRGLPAPPPHTAGKFVHDDGKVK